jgi:LysR family glycine cleavage system transcriptional activator
MRRLPPLNSLKAFEAVARIGSVVGAAEELCVSHGAVSKQLLNLERWLRVPLFNRSSGKMAITSAGRHLLEEVGASLDRIADAVGQIAPDGDERVLVVSAPPTMTLHWLVPRLTSFIRQHPDIRIQLNNRRDRETALPGGVDVAIRRGHTPHPLLTAVAFMNEAVTPVCSPDLLCKQNGALEQLAHAPWLRADMRPQDWRHWLTFADVPDLQPSASLSFDHTYLALEAALDGLGVAMGPRYLVQDDIDAGKLAVIFPRLLAPSSGYFFVYETRRHGDPAIVALQTWLAAEGQAHEAFIQQRLGTQAPLARRSR